MKNLIFAFAICISSLCLSQEVKIGKQIWMAENLNSTKFRNGDIIPLAKTEEEWIKAGENKQPAWCYYGNRSIQDDPNYGDKYGKLYNWYAVNDPRGLAPIGWHIPSDDEWTMLTNFLGGKSQAGEKLKSASGWRNNEYNTNESGFLALPGGHRNAEGLFESIGLNGYWWTSTIDDEFKDDVVYRLLGYNFPEIDRFIIDMSCGFSVRCIKDQ